MRKRIERLVNRTGKYGIQNRIYNLLMMAAALLSVVPLMFKEQQPWMATLDLWTVYLLFVDFVLHWMVADLTHEKLGRKALFVYPLMPVALLNFVSLLPSLGLLPESLRILRLCRLVVVLQYSQNFQTIVNVLKREKQTLLTVLYISVAYIFLSALIMFVAEPETFPTFFEAIYWATTALTTVGYGDVYPHAIIGRVVSMISSIFGIAIIALPAGVVTAGFMQEIEQRKNKREEALTRHAAQQEKKLADTQEELDRVREQLREQEAKEGVQADG